LQFEFRNYKSQIANYKSSVMSTSPQPTPDQVRATERALYATAFLVFLATAGVTLWFVWTMRGGMRMPGGWTMSMMWMRMPGQGWLAAGAVFAAMWLAMMVAMMLPSTFPLLAIYRRAAIFRGDAHAGRNTWLLAAGYFFVWLLFGVVAYALGVTLARATMHSLALSHAIPFLAGGALVVAGVYQLTPWKSACLSHCRDPLLLVANHLHGGGSGALRLGLHHGLFCAGCCWALMLMQLTVGVMSVPMMAAVAVVIAVEKLWVRGPLVAKVSGVASIVAGVALVAVR
jgi:predicted metal-binding membrane protein